MSKSSANDPATPQVLDSTELAAFKQALLRKRENLTRHQDKQLSELYAADKHHLADLEEMGSDMADTDPLCEIMDINASTIDQIDRALDKLSQGIYGRCAHCDLPIPRARLQALPFAELCVECQRKKEQGLLGLADEEDSDEDEDDS